MSRNYEKEKKGEKELGYIHLFNSLEETLKTTRRLDKRRIMKAKMNRVKNFLKIKQKRREGFSKVEQIKDESLLRMHMLVSRHDHILKLKPSRLSRIKSFIKYFFIIVVDKLSSMFSSVLSPFSPPPVMHSGSRTFTYKELQEWSRSFSLKLMGQIKRKMEKIKREMKKWRTGLIVYSKLKADMEKRRKKRIERHKKTLELLKSTSTRAIQRGRDTAFKYIERLNK